MKKPSTTRRTWSYIMRRLSIIAKNPVRAWCFVQLMEELDGGMGLDEDGDPSFPAEWLLMTMTGKPAMLRALDAYDRGEWKRYEGEYPRGEENS